jgi:diguanylate cyclase (GGDEF)-like protein/PAS domain S-box-containing protein
MFAANLPLSADEITEKLPRNVLIINSYHKGYQWTDEQSESALREILSIPNTTTDVIYMDWKRFPFPETILNLQKTLDDRYKNGRIDLILTSDDAALSFAVKNRKPILKNAPIIFMGIFAASDAKLTNHEPEITGVYETVDLEGTIKNAIHIFPKSKEIYLIHDGSETSVAMEAEYNRILGAMDVPLKRNVLRSYVFRDLLDLLLKMDKDSIVINGSYARDPENLTLPPEEFARQMSERCTVPLFVMYTHMLGTGAFGGSLLDGNLQGKTAGIIAKEVLGGKNINGILRVSEKTVYPCYDYNVMKRFGVSSSRLPAGSVIINQPPSFIDQYQDLVVGIAAVFVIMSFMIGVLYINAKRRKLTEAQLHESHHQLRESTMRLREQVEALQKSEDNLRKKDLLYQMITEAAQDIIWDWDFSERRIFPQRINEILGYPSDYIRTQDIWNSLIHPEDLAAMNDKIETHMRGLSPSFQSEFRVRKQNGEYAWFSVSGKVAFDKFGNPQHMAGTYTDITAAKKRQERIDHLAFFDSLTGLPNRIQLRERVEKIIERLRKDGGLLSMMFIDMDNFKYINDSFGHLDGDELLIKASERLQEFTPQNGFVSRLGGDEFIIVIEGTDAPDGAEALAPSIQNAFLAPFEVGRNQFYITFSMGIVSWPKDGDTYDELLKNADTALYSSKESGKGRFVHFKPEMNRSVVERTMLQSKLRKALELGEFHLHYQPQAHADTLALRGFEALVRWNDPVTGMVSPQKFIPACEETGQIVPLGSWILSTACRRMKSLIDEGNPDLIMSVNISVVQLSQGTFTDIVKRTIAETGISPHNLEIEITESIMIESFESNVQKLRELAALGIHIALDDFGSGYSSLNYLRKLPITTLKIDKSFIDNIQQDFESRSLVNSIIDIARIMDLEVIAEGIENDVQRAILADQKCHWIQGYVISKPMPSEEVDGFIAKWVK